METSSPSREPGAARLLSRALRLRCPYCGRGPLFTAWLRMAGRCDVCGFRPDRGETDAFIGGYTVNLIVSEVLPVGIGVGMALATWPDVPWRALTYGLAGLMLVAPIATYPFAKAAWLGIDLIFRPPVRGDFEDGAPTA